MNLKSIELLHILLVTVLLTTPEIARANITAQHTNIPQPKTFQKNQQSIQKTGVGIISPTTPFSINVTLTDSTIKPTDANMWSPSPGTAAFLTLLGSSLVAIILFFARTKHEREMRKIESDAKLREKIYLEAAEAASWAMFNFGKLIAGQANDYFESSKDDKLSIATAKMNLIAKDATLQKLDAFNNIFLESTLDLAAKGAVLESLDQEADRISKRISENLVRQEQIISRWKETPTTQRTEELQSQFADSFKTASHDFDRMDHERNEYWKRADIGRRELWDYGLKTIEKVVLPLAELSIAIRDEMEIPVDKEAFIKRSKKSAETIQDHLSKFRNNLFKN